MRRLVFVLISLMLGNQALAQHGHQPMHQRFEDAERWAKVFDDPGRDEWQKPAEVIAALKLARNATVADIGAGTGYFSVRLARAVPEGAVYGADVEPGMVRYLRQRAATEKLANIQATLAGTNGPNLPGPVDLALVVDTYHHIGDRTAYFRALKASLKPGGRVAIVDFKPDSPVGPPPQHRVREEAVMKEMGAAGYKVAERFGFLPYQYLLVFSTSP
jgi:cyclopropane fatty-acyl-phospholipid synthase-like methyltransferase